MLKYIVILITSVLVIGCSSDKEKVFERLKPDDDEKYSIMVFSKESIVDTSYHERIGKAVFSNGLDSFSMKILDGKTNYKYDYENVFSIENYPLIIVFDSNGVALRTDSTEELQTFLSE